MAGAPHSSCHEITSSLVPLYRYPKTSWLIGVKDFPTQPPWNQPHLQDWSVKKAIPLWAKRWSRWSTAWLDMLGMSNVKNSETNLVGQQTSKHSNTGNYGFPRANHCRSLGSIARVYPTPVYWTTHATPTATSKTSRAGRELTRSWCGDVHSLLVSPPA